MHRRHVSALSRLRLRRRTRGFTLIELMITVAILGIILAIALPSYSAYIRKSRRADAMASLSAAQTALERCYAANFTYANPPCADPPATSSKGYYTLAMVSTATTYTLTATATGPQVDDTTCASMSIDNANQMTALDASAVAQTRCWNP